MFKHNTKAALNSYIAGAKPISGIHTVLVDESWYNEKIEYLYKDSTLSRLSNPKIEFIRLVDVANFAAIATTYTSPVNKNMVVVLADETAGNKTTWYTYNVSAWVLMGEFLGTKMERATSKGDTRGAVIHELTDFTIPFKYTVGRNELAIYVGGVRLSDTDFLEIGTTGVLSNKVQFTSAIMNGTEIEFVREVHSNETTDPAYQIVQQKIIDDAIVRQRTEFLKTYGKVYGGTIQECKLRDPNKVYWCDVNKNWYEPSSVNSSIVPKMTANACVVNGVTYVASASSEHLAPFPAYLAFDRIDGTTFWHSLDDGNDISSSNTEWLKIDMGAARKFTHILMRGRKGYDVQFPNAYIIQGSNDDTTWVDLYTKTDNTHYQTDNNNVIPISGEYRYIKLIINSVQGTYSRVASLSQFIVIDTTIPGSWTVADTDWNLVYVRYPTDLKFT